MAEKTNPVNWFEISVVDLERAIKFYERALGYRLEVHDMGFVKMAWFPEMISDAYGATGSLVRGEGYVPSQGGTLVYFPVDDIDGVLDRVAANGGKTLLPRTDIGEYGFIAHFLDSEGNRIGLHSMK